MVGTIQVSITSMEDGSLSYVASSETPEPSSDFGDLHDLKCSPEVGSTVVPWTGEMSVIILHGRIS